MLNSQDRLALTKKSFLENFKKSNCGILPPQSAAK
jgi:hypothetical protein